MSYENIKLKYSNFTLKDGYFFTFVHDNNILFKKNSRGDVVFTYPLTTSLDGNEVIDVCCDAINFWTLQQSSSSTRRVIKKWRIESNTCNLIDRYDFGDASNYYSTNTFAIETFSSTLAYDLPYGSTAITLSGVFNFDIPTGTVVTIGPNIDGFHEEVTVTGTISSNHYGLDFFTSLDHTAGETISFVNNFWMFNKYKGTTTNPVLSRYNLVNNEFDYFLEDSSFETTTGSTFYVDDEDNCYILYVYGTTIRFFNIATSETERTLTTDNIRTDGVTIIPVYGLEVDGGTIYRLQNYMKYFGTDYSQTTYNYQSTPIRPFIDSVSMEVYPKILPSNGVNIATVQVAMQDQYGDPAQYKTAHLSDNDDYGYMTIAAPLTNLQGVATSYYRAGLTVRQVTITVYATQYD